jgi:hypothetical protein
MKAEIRALQSGQDKLWELMVPNVTSQAAPRNVNIIKRIIEMARESPQAARQMFTPKSRRGRSHPLCVDGEWCPESHMQVIHLNGCKFTKSNGVYIADDMCKGATVSTSPGPGGEVKIVDWKASEWMTDKNKGKVFSAKAFEFNQKEGNITIKENGIYYVYSQFYFVSAGVRCCYRLRYGVGAFDYVTCIQDMNNSMSIGATTPDSIHSWRPCFLGFTKYLEKGTVLRLDYFDSDGICQADIKRGLRHSYWGAIQLGKTS